MNTPISLAALLERFFTERLMRQPCPIHQRADCDGVGETD
jgi:hypothetical protein